MFLCQYLIYVHYGYIGLWPPPHVYPRSINSTGFQTFLIHCNDSKPSVQTRKWHQKEFPPHSSSHWGEIFILRTVLKFSIFIFYTFCSVLFRRFPLSLCNFSLLLVIIFTVPTLNMICKPTIKHFQCINILALMISLPFFVKLWLLLPEDSVAVVMKKIPKCVILQQPCSVICTYAPHIECVYRLIFLAPKPFLEYWVYFSNCPLCSTVQLKARGHPPTHTSFPFGGPGKEAYIVYGTTS